MRVHGGERQVQVRRTRDLAVLAGVVLAMAGGSPAMVLAPSMTAVQGYNDNVNAKPDEAAPGVLQERSSYVLLQPGVRIVVPLSSAVAAGVRYQAEWERYDAAVSGNSLGQTGSTDLGVTAGPWRGSMAGSYTVRAYSGIVDDQGREFLNQHAIRGSLGNDLTLMQGRRLFLTAGGAMTRRTYPAYLVITDPSAPGERHPRGADQFSLSAGPGSQVTPWLLVAGTWQMSSDRENALAPQGLRYADFFSYRSQGGQMQATLQPLAALRLDLTGMIQRRRFTGRLDAAGTGHAAANMAVAGAGATWTFHRGASVVLEYQFVRYDGGSPTSSFSSNRLTAGMQLAESFNLFAPAPALVSGGETAVPPAMGTGRVVPESKAISAEEELQEARSAYDRAEYDEAIRRVEAIVATAPANWRAWGLLGNIHLKMGSKKAALTAYHRSLSLNPENTQLKSWIEKLESE